MKFLTTTWEFSKANVFESTLNKWRNVSIHKFICLTQEGKKTFLLLKHYALTFSGLSYLFKFQVFE